LERPIASGRVDIATLDHGLADREPFGIVLRAAAEIVVDRQKDQNRNRNCEKDLNPGEFHVKRISVLHPVSFIHFTQQTLKPARGVSILATGAEPGDPRPGIASDVREPQDFT
jgi:hypothetical protein